MANRPWTEEELSYLRNKTRSTTARHVADAIGRSVPSVNHKAEQLGIKFSSWTEEDDRFLQDNWGYNSIEYICNKLERTYSAIHNRVFKLGLGSFVMASDKMTVSMLFKTLGKDVSSLPYWVGRGFPMQRRKIRTRYMNFIDIDKFWEWAEYNQDIINFAKLEPLALGEEPEWVAEARKRRHRLANKFKTSEWTESEVQQLTMLLKRKKYTIRELSESMMRSEEAIEQKMKDVGGLPYPVKSKPIPWSRDEEELLIELHNDKMQVNLIMEQLPLRSSMAIRGKLCELRKRGIL